MGFLRSLSAETEKRRPRRSREHAGDVADAACVHFSSRGAALKTFHVRDHASVATNSSPPGGFLPAASRGGPDVAESKKRMKNSNEVEDDTEIQN